MAPVSHLAAHKCMHYFLIQHATGLQLFESGKYSLIFLPFWEIRFEAADLEIALQDWRFFSSLRESTSKHSLIFIVEVVVNHEALLSVVDAINIRMLFVISHSRLFA